MQKHFKYFLILALISFFSLISKPRATNCFYSKVSQDGKITYFEILNIESVSQVGQKLGVIYAKYDEDDNLISSNYEPVDYSIYMTTCESRVYVDEESRNIGPSAVGDYTYDESKTLINNQSSDSNWSGIFYDEDDGDRGEFLNSGYVSCGNNLVRNIPTIIPNISSSLYNLVMVLVPTLLVIFGMLDLVKGIVSQKEDEIRKGRSTFVKRTIIGLLTFLVVLLTKLLLGLVGGHGNVARIVGCVDCFVSGGNSCDDNSFEQGVSGG